MATPKLSDMMIGGDGWNNAHWLAKGVMGLTLLALVVVIVWGICRLAGFETFYPTPDAWNRLTGAGTPLDFDIVRPEGFREGYSPGDAVANNKCGAHRSNGPVAANACDRAGAPISANRVVRLISDTPSGCDCTCSCPSQPGDVLGVIQSISPSQLNQPIGAVSAYDEAQMAASAARNSAQQASGAVADAMATGNVNESAKKYAAMAMNSANRASQAAAHSKSAAADNKVLDAERASKEAKANANDAHKYKNATMQSLSGGRGVSEMSVLSNVMQGTPFGPEHAKPASDNNKSSQKVMSVGGSPISAYKKGKSSGVRV